MAATAQDAAQPGGEARPRKPLGEPGRFRRMMRLIARLLGDNARAHWPSYALAFLMLLVVSACTALTAYVMEDVINEIFVERRREAIAWVALVVGGIFLAKGFAAYGSAVLLGRIGNRIVSRLQNRFFQRLMAQGLDFHRAYDHGALVTRFTHNADAARQAIEQLTVSFSRDILSLIGLVAVMIHQDAQLSLFALLIAPPAVLLTMSIMRRIKRVAAAELALLGEKTQILKEAALGVRVVKAFTHEDAMNARMSGAVERFQERADRIVGLSAVSVPMMEALGGVAVAAAIFYGGYQVIDGGAEPGAFFSFITALLLAYDPARRLARFNVTFQRNLVAVEQLYEFIDAPMIGGDKPDARPIEIRQGGLSFEKVSFRYGGDAAALNDLTLEFAAGRTTALVGPSGAGKSTILALIQRFYEPEEGRILLDGAPIADATLKSLRGGMAYVTQDTFLFDGTVRENLLIGRPDADQSAVVAAAKAANAHEFIVDMPGGYDARVGEGGERLSGGQRQRLSIARAMLRDARILLLDEATAALDTVSEAKVQEALGRLMAGRTTIVIAHRLATIWRADHIHVIEAGRVVESGRHDDLVKRGGLYAALYNAQGGGAFQGDPAVIDA